MYKIFCFLLLFCANKLVAQNTVAFSFLTKNGKNTTASAIITSEDTLIAKAEFADVYAVYYKKRNETYLRQEKMMLKLFVDDKFDSDFTFDFDTNKKTLFLNLKSSSIQSLHDWFWSRLSSYEAKTHKITLVAQAISGNGKGLDIVAEGSFQYNLLQKSKDIFVEKNKKIPLLTFQKLDKTNDDTEYSWTWVSEQSKGYLKTVAPKKIDEWIYEIGNNKGTIKMMANVSEWELTADDGSVVKIRAKGFKDPTSWTVSDGTFRFKIATKYGENFDDWVIIDEDNKPMRMKLIYKDNYNFWQVEDLMPDEDIHMKVGSLFICFAMGRYFGQI